MKILKSILIWLLVMPMAIINGILRDNVIEPLFGSNIALPLSGIILSIGIILVTFLLLPKLGKGKMHEFVLIGLVWVVLSNVFDLLMTMFQNRPIDDFLNMYDITTGNLWCLVIITFLLSPILVAKKRNLITA